MPKNLGKSDKHDPRTWFWPLGQPESLQNSIRQKPEKKEENEMPRKNVGKPKGG